MRQNHNIFYTVLAVVCLCSFYGCNPYASQFACPKTENGRCVSVSDAYAESLRPAPFESEEDVRNKKKDRQQVPNDLSWQREMQKKIGNLLREPNAPLIAQPNVMRVLMLPYRGDQNELYMLRFVYMFVDEPRWIMGDYLINNQKTDGVR